MCRNPDHGNDIYDLTDFLLAVSKTKQNKRNLGAVQKSKHLELSS